MTPTWRSEDEMALRRPSGRDWLRVLRRGSPMAIVVFGGLAIHLLLRIPERAIHRDARPWTPHVTVAVCRLALRTLGLRHRTEGRPLNHPGAAVANHASWLDVLTINASSRVVFTAKEEVAHWPGIGWLARATGTLFVSRDRAAAKEEARRVEQRLSSNERLLFFPEGTSTDGQRVIPFKAALFSALYGEGVPDEAHVQPVTVVYEAPEDSDPRYYSWWGDMDFGPHLLHILAAPRHGNVTVRWHPPLAVKDFTDRKALAKAAEEAVRAGLPD